ncbi:uncharacterized protein PG986_003880 [Apiospora aurea]|uniref:Rhodopsin domain-containing protein n=1 Tax=Apiospora aurea TaxID=335848 RepID=A0ABR1QL02_9PEZI
MADKDNLLLEDPYFNTSDQKRNFFDPESKVSTVVGVSVFLMFLATASVAARFWARVRILRMTGPDDWLVLLSSGLVIGHGVICCCMTNSNLGRHVGFMTEKDEFMTFMKMFYSSLVVYNAALMTIKLAFLAQSQMVIVVFQCQPIFGFWAPTPSTVCVPSIPGLYISAAGNIATDIMIKAVLSIVFCLGLVTTLISLLRLQYLKVSPDITWDIADSNLCSLAEISSGIICACLPTLKPLAAQCFPKLFSTLRSQLFTRAPTPEWKPRGLKSMLRGDQGSVQGLPLAYLSMESLRLAPLPLSDEKTPITFPPHPGVRRHYEPSSRRLSSTTTKTSTTTNTPTKNNRQSSQSQPGGGYYGRGQSYRRGHNHKGNTVEIGAARSLSTRSGRKSRRSSQSDASIYVKHEITVEVEEGWERRSSYSSTL